jgi:hypothetical protein
MSTHIAVLFNDNCTTVIIAFTVNVSKSRHIFPNSAGWVDFCIYKNCVILCYELGIKRESSTFLLKFSSTFSSSIGVTATLSGIWPKNVAWTWKHDLSTTADLYKGYHGYHPENTADEGGPAEKSQECRRYPPTLLQGLLKMKLTSGKVQF